MTVELWFAGAIYVSPEQLQAATHNKLWGDEYATAIKRLTQELPEVRNHFSVILISKPQASGLGYAKRTRLAAWPVDDVAVFVGTVAEFQTACKKLPDNNLSKAIEETLSGYLKSHTKR